MWLRGVLIAALVLHWSSIVSAAAGKKIVCYYGSWAVYRPGEGKFDVEDIDPNICTHINYGFIGINNDGTNRIMDSWNEVDKAALNRFSCLKEINPDLKVLLANGGWNEGSTKYSDVAKDPARRATFIKTAVDLIKTYGFDGFDLDWEYPNQRGGIPEDVPNFVQWLKEFREEFDKHGYLLTAAVASANFSASLSYDIPEISKYLDFINVMTYDLHGTWDGVTGHNSPLYAASHEVTDLERQLNVDACISFWINSGAPPEKLILGIGLYGRTFTTGTSNDPSLALPAYNGGAAGPYTRESGYLGYNEICVNIQQGGWTVSRHPEQLVPIAVKSNQWVGYDDPDSIAIKAEYVLRRKLGGIMIWSFETDDFRGKCGLRNPLLNAIRTGLGYEPSYGDGWKSKCVGQTNNGGGGGGGGGSVVPPPSDGTCSQVGYVRDSKNCAIFYYCEVSGSSWRVHTFQCQSGLWYDTVSGVCNWPQGECGGESDETNTGGDSKETDPVNPGDGDNPTNPGDDDDDNQTNPGDDDNQTNPGDDDNNQSNPGDDDDNKTNPGDDDNQTNPGGDDNQTNPGDDDNNQSSPGDDDDDNQTNPGDDDNQSNPGGDDNQTNPGDGGNPTNPDGLNSEESNEKSPETVSGRKVVCYYGSWAVYRPGEGKFDVEDIDPNICTHINYGFIGINNDGTNRIMDSWNEVDKAALNRFSCLKEINPDLKVLLANGGWNEGSTKYSDVAKDPARRATFIKTAVDLIKTYNFDGFDLDWEYPNQRGGIPEDVPNFVQWLKEFREEFDKHGYLLTAAVASANFSASLSYDIPEISKYLDFINVMTYDLHGTWDGVTGHNSPLYPASHEVTDLERQLNVDACISFWIDSGAPPEKLILGIGLYGRTFTTGTSNDPSLALPAYNGGAAGPYTRESGYLGYNEICDNIQQGGWTVFRHPEQLVPIAVKGNQWVGYDDPESIDIKAKYVLRRKLGGIMIWSFETDDFRGKCGLRNPLLNAIRTGLGYEPSYGDGWKSKCAGQTNSGGGGGGGGGSVVPPPPDGTCSQVGYVRDSKNCAIFYYCEVSGSSWRVHTFQCQSGLWYDPASGVCNWPQGECGGESDETNTGGDSKETDPVNPGDGDNPTNPGDDDDNQTNPGDDDNQTNPGDDDNNQTNPGDDDNQTNPGGDDNQTNPGDDDNRTNPGDDDDNPTNPGDDDDNPTNPGDDDDNPTNPGDDDNQTNPGGDDNPTDPDGSNSEDSNEKPPETVSGYKVVCYYGSWAVYRPGDGKFDVEDIDPNVCTHINFGFTGINNDGTVRILDSWNEVDKAALKRFACLKKLNPNLKALIAIGGWNEGSTKYSEVARDPNKRATFIKSAISLIQKYDFDGFDLDWEYPNQRGGIPADVANFVQLLKEFRVEFDKLGYLLTAAVASAEASASLSYDILQVAKYLDFINVMTYDLHGVWDGVTGHNSPLYASPDGLDVDTCISYWINSGAPPEKLILGIGTYGRTFTLSSQTNNAIGAPIYNGGTAGPYTRESGYLGYNEICVNLQQDGWTVVRHEEQKVPYAHKGNQWVGYDDPTSISAKAEYVRNRGLGGIMIWSFETDDFKNACGEGRNPLLNAIRTGLGLPKSIGDGKESPCANSSNIIWWDPGNNNGGGGWEDPGNGGSSNPPAPDGICSSVGYVRDPENCGIFYYCQAHASSWIVSSNQCPTGTYYDLGSGICDWADKVSCP